MFSYTKRLLVKRRGQIWWSRVVIEVHVLLRREPHSASLSVRAQRPRASQLDAWHKTMCDHICIHTATRCAVYRRTVDLKMMWSQYLVLNSIDSLPSHPVDRRGGHPECLGRVASTCTMSWRGARTEAPFSHRSDEV